MSPTFLFTLDAIITALISYVFSKLPEKCCGTGWSMKLSLMLLYNQLPVIFSCEVTLFVNWPNLVTHTLSLTWESPQATSMWMVSLKHDWSNLSNCSSILAHPMSREKYTTCEHTLIQHVTENFYGISILFEGCFDFTQHRPWLCKLRQYTSAEIC